MYIYIMYYTFNNYNVIPLLILLLIIRTRCICVEASEGLYSLVSIMGTYNTLQKACQY